jgi:hypothetical protein
VTLVGRFRVDFDAGAWQAWHAQLGRVLPRHRRAHLTAMSIIGKGPVAEISVAGGDSAGIFGGVHLQSADHRRRYL